MLERVGIAAVVALALAAGGCGVADSGTAQEITPGLGLDDTSPTTSSTTTTVASVSTLSSVAAATTTSTTPVQTENVQLWFISGTTLNAINTSLTYPATLDQVMAALQRGPEGLPPASSLRSAIPGAPRLAVTDDENGTAIVDLPPDFFGNIQGDDQRRAIGQIVLTLTLRPGIGGVRFTSGGEDYGVVLGSGEQSPKGRVVTRADYRALTGEVPPTSTATSTTAAPTTTTVAAAVDPTPATTAVPG